MKPFYDFLKTTNPAVILAVGYLSYVLAGWILLSTAWAQVNPISSLDTLFIATSAVSTTGLVTVDPGTSFTLFGQVTILLLIQLGGIGYMTFGSFVMIATRHKMTPLRADLSRAAFALPHDFKIMRFIRLVVIFTLVCEIVGATLLYFVFSKAGVENPAWSAVFHSVSAFCTAGFSLYSNSFEDFSANVPLNIIISTLSYLGAIGFVVMTDFWQKITGQRRHLHFVSRVIIQITLWFTVLGTAALFLLEPSIAELANWERLMTAFFQVMTASTTVGFNTIPISGLSIAVLMVLFLLMMFGASPSGTGGGLKSTTLAALLAIMRSTLKGREEITYKRRTIDLKRQHLASASLTFYLGVLFLSVFTLTIIESSSFETLLFECISALGTVGLSMGITGDISNLGKLVIVVLMFMGRVGILTFGIAVSLKDDSPEQVADNELV